MLGCIEDDFAKKYGYAFCIIFQALQDLRTTAPFGSNLETMKSASDTRHPGAKHNPGEENNIPQHCSEACGK